jgi:hypothetical protein
MNSFRYTCYVGRCVNRGDYLCPSCRRYVCENHAQTHLCVNCYQQAMEREQSDGMTDVDFGLSEGDDAPEPRQGRR